MVRVEIWDFLSFVFEPKYLANRPLNNINAVTYNPNSRTPVIDCSFFHTRDINRSTANMISSIDPR